jgi:hypothetical protein
LRARRRLSCYGPARRRIGCGRLFLTGLFLTGLNLTGLNLTRLFLSRLGLQQ